MRVRNRNTAGEYSKGVMEGGNKGGREGGREGRR